jgi:hypothetical protein
MTATFNGVNLISALKNRALPPEQQIKPEFRGYTPTPGMHAWLIRRGIPILPFNSNARYDTVCATNCCSRALQTMP